MASRVKASIVAVSDLVRVVPGEFFLGEYSSDSAVAGQTGPESWYASDGHRLRPGRLTIPVARAVEPGGEVVALDIQEGMLDRLRKGVDATGLKNIRPILGGIGQAEIESNSFDRALLVTVLGEIPDREAALREIYRILKPGGILSITEIFPDPHYQTRFTVRTLCEAAGFQLAKEFGHVLAFTMNWIKPDSKF